ncbi:MAG: hypothetical protein D6775_10965 [Caldilineae bacterium]|nr:MAG: hypothetical protein D6775_10965 [Caldilineae bacterium]
MNAINRFVAVLVFLLLLLGIIALALFPGEGLNWLQLQLGNLNGQIARWQMSDPTNFNIGRVAVVVAALLVFIPLLMAEFARKAEPVARFRTPEGEGHVSTDSVARRLAWHLDQLADVIHVYPEIQSHGDHIDVRLEIVTTPEIDVPMKTEEIMLVTREIVEDAMGLQLGKLSVRIRHSEYSEIV